MVFSILAGDSPADPSPSPLGAKTTIREPMKNALARVNKKPFGLYVSPDNSPVNPEHFTGYHTGVDFETTAGEQNQDVDVYVICSGPLISKTTATGYGGIAVQSCKIDGQSVTVVYGHIRLSSVSAKTGDQLAAGDHLAVLGTTYSAETGDERKHLHLGIHKGNSVNILGYAQRESDLSQWLNVAAYLP